MENGKSDSLLFRVDHLAGDAPTVGEKEKDKQSAEPQDAILCRTCGTLVTTRSEKIVMGGSHAHTFFNPASRPPNSPGLPDTSGVSPSAAAAGLIWAGSSKAGTILFTA